MRFPFKSWNARCDRTQAQHIASLTSMLKEFYWQGMTDHGSQALAMQLYDRGARAPHGHFHPEDQHT